MKSKQYRILAVLFLVLGFFFTPLARCADANLSISISSSPNPASTGSNLTYTITVTNAGPDLATGVVVTNNLSAGQGSGACPIPGPAAWWKAEADANDAVGGIHGTLQNGATFAPGKVGDAFSLDGVDDYVSIPDAPSLRPSDFTIEGWFQPTDVATTRILVAKALGSSFHNSFAIYISAGVFNALVSDGSSFSFLNDTTALVAGEWYHVAYAFDDANDTHTLYVNGVSGDSDTSLTTVPYDGNPLLIGADVEDGTNPALFYSGLIDEVTIYNRALTAAEVQSIYTADSDGKCPSSPLILVGDLPSQTATNLTVFVFPTICSGTVSNVVRVTTTATDLNMANNIATNTVSVLDRTAPSITCLADLMVNVDVGGCAASAVALGTPVTSDNCGVATLTSNAPAVFAVGTTTVTWTVTDISGRTNTCQQVVTVVDSEPPSITCPGDVMVNVDSGQCTASSVNLGTPTTDDNCSGENVTNDAPTSFPAGTTTVTWTVTDTGGNTVTCEQRVTVIESELPSITCPAALSIQCYATVAVPSLEGIVATDNCGIPTTSHVEDANSTNGCQITILRTFKTTDAAGNMATCTQTITVEDTLPPEIQCPPELTITCTDTNEIGACANLSITDNCDAELTISYEPAEGASFTAGTNLVRCVAVDDCGNTAMCTFTMVVMEAAPALIIQRQGTTLTLCWETTVSGYVLQEKTALTPADNWMPTAEQPVQNGNTYCVNTTTGSTSKYYRLCLDCQ